MRDPARIHQAGLAHPVRLLRPFEGNPRLGDVDAIVESLRTNGQYRPLVVRRDDPGEEAEFASGEVLAGNHTLEAARALGWDTVAVVWVDVSDEQARRIVLADNRTADLGRYDTAALAALLEGLGGDLAGTGYEVGDVAQLLADLDAADSTPWADRPVRPLPESATARFGQRWRLGPHTLVVGDSRGASSWAGCPAPAMLLTDPPYGIDYDGGATYLRDAIAGDADGWQAAALLSDVLEAVPLPAGCLVYVFTASGADGVLVQAELVRRHLMRWGLVWVKDRATLGRADYQHQHELLAGGVAGGDEGMNHIPADVTLEEAEPIGYGWVPGAAHVRVVDRRHTTVLYAPKPAQARLHPTMKPVSLLAQILAAHRLPAGSVVVDAFAGSGSTLVAAHQAGLVCWAVEQDPRYADVILDRWRDGTGLEPVLLEEPSPGDREVLDDASAEPRRLAVVADA